MWIVMIWFCWLSCSEMVILLIVFLVWKFICLFCRLVVVCSGWKKFMLLNVILLCWIWLWLVWVWLCLLLWFWIVRVKFEVNFLRRLWKWCWKWLNVFLLWVRVIIFCVLWFLIWLFFLNLWWCVCCVC